MAQVKQRTLELVTAVVTAAFGGIVAAESMSHDVGWTENGPGAGYFPFRIGLLIIAASVLIFLQAARDSSTGVFVTGEEFRRSFSVFWPTAVLIAGMQLLGCYVPSALYLTWMMHRHGNYGWPRSFATAVVVMLIFFAIFEFWFQVPLAKGPLENALGIY